MLKRYPKGSDITVIDVRYAFPEKKDNDKWTKGSLTIVAKDNVTGKKFIETIDNPDYEYYIAKEDVGIDHNLFFIEQDKVDKVTVPYIDLEKDIAERTGNLEFFYDNIKNGNRSANKILHTHPRVFFSDTNIEDHYRFRFARDYQNNIGYVQKAFFDIEADTLHMKGDFPEMGECPVNALTMIDLTTNKSFTLLLRNKNNPLIEKFEKSINNAFFDRLKAFIISNVGGPKQAAKYGIDKLQYEFFFYDEEDEIKLIQDAFIILNTLQPDFVLAWNMAFDIPYIIQRVINLGYDPAEIMSHPDFKYKTAKYFIDERSLNEFAERGDFATISSYSVFLDQMIQFASRRKGQSAFPSYRLDDIGELIAGVNKLDYKHITTDIAQLPYKDYETFVFYNIMDVIVQVCIESKIDDIGYVFGKSIANNTRYSKVHRQTVYLANRGAWEFYQDGYIIGNNNNRRNEKPPKFPGAFVADPTKVSDYAKVKINGIPINVYDNVDDFDYARLYPSILQEFNMAPNTQIGRINIPEQVHDKENRFHDEKYARSGAFLEDLQSHNFLEFGTRWLHLADYMELIKDINEFFTTKYNPSNPLRWCSSDGMMIPVFYTKEGLMTIPVSYSNELIRPLDYCSPMPKK